MDDAVLTLELRHLRVLQSPVRHEVWAALVEAGPCSVSELAERMGRSPASLYYHVHRLAGSGLVEELGQRSAATRPETVYRAHDWIRLRPESEWTGAYRRAQAKLHGSSLRLMGRRISSYLEGGGRGEGSEGDFVVRQYRIRATASHRRRLRRGIEALDELIREIGDSDAGEPTSVMIVQVPIVE